MSSASHSNLQNKIALFIGASGGIGKVTALASVRRSEREDLSDVARGFSPRAGVGDVPLEPRAKASRSVGRGETNTARF